MNVCCQTPPATTALIHPKILEWAFGRRMTPAERLRKHQRALEKTQRELDRERVKLENQEKKLVADIKKSAKNGQMGPLRIQAKDLVRTRRCSLNLRDDYQSDCSLVVKIYPKVLFHAHPTTSNLPPNPGQTTFSSGRLNTFTKHA